MTKTSLSLAAAIAAGLFLTAMPASAQNQQVSPNVQTADRNARAAIRGIYGAAGQVACGGNRICRRPAAAVGEAVYDTAQRISIRESRRLQELGRRIRERGRN